MKSIDFGTRHCPHCDVEVPVSIFGRHLMVTDHLLALGFEKVFELLTESIEESIRRAVGHPEALATLQAARRVLAIQREEVRNAARGS